MSYTQQLLKQFTSAFPKITTLASALQKRNSFIVNYPLVLNPTSSKRLSLVSLWPVPKNHDLILLSIEECLFSTNLVGAAPMEFSLIQQKLQEMAGTHQFMNPDFIQRLLANTQKLKLGEMPLRNYCQYVLNSHQPPINKQQINSRFLMELSLSMEISNHTTFLALNKEILKRTQEDDYIKACETGRMVIRDAGNTPFKFAAPFIDKIDHSFDPNCVFDLLYFPHRRTPFMRIKTLRALAQNQRPTINYGKLNNYQLLLRYKFAVPDNPHRVFMLPLNFELIMETFNKNIQWKQEQFLKQGMKLKNYIRILPQGQLAQQDLKMMRILVHEGSQPKPQDINSGINDQLVYSFVCGHARQMKQNLKINSSKVSNNKQVLTLEREQSQLIDTFLQKQQK